MSIIQSVRVGVAGMLRRYCSWRLLFPMFLGVLFGFGDEVSVRRGRLDCYSLMLYMKMLVFAVLFAVMFALVERLAHILTERERLDARPTFMFDWSPASIMVGFAGIAVCWLPYLVLLFPGVYWSDTSRQLVMYYGGEPIMDQHPFFDTYLFGWFADLGQLVFSNRLLGLYLLVGIQCFGMAALFSVMTSYIKRIGAPQWLCWTVYAVVSLFPLFPIMFSSLAKDTINALFVVPFDAGGGDRAFPRRLFTQAGIGGVAGGGFTAHVPDQENLRLHCGGGVAGLVCHQVWCQVATVPCRHGRGTCCGNVRADSERGVPAVEH